MGTIFTSFVEFVKSHLKAAAIIAAGLLVIILLLLILVFVRSRANKTETARQAPLTIVPGGPRTLSTEDFFLPYEPDFVPDVLLEREPKNGWTEEDARPFWTNPMEGNEETWRKRIEGGVDSLLEHVP